MRSARFWLAVVAVTMVVGGCSASEPVATEAPEPTPEMVPRLVAATDAFARLVGTEFTEASLPAEVQPDPVGGGALLNVEADPADEDTFGMFWAIGDDVGRFLVARIVARDDSGVPTWRVDSAWDLVKAPGTHVTVGTHVCLPPPGGYDRLNGELIVVTADTWDVALGAWTMTAAGAEPYGDLSELECERFDP